MFPQRGRVIALGVVLCVLVGTSGNLVELLAPTHEEGDCGCPAGCACRKAGRCSCNKGGLRLRALCSCGNNSHGSDIHHSAPEIVFVSIPVANLPRTTPRTLGGPEEPPDRLLIREKDHPS